jgi:DNA polymerase-3 subunit delta
LSRLAVAVEQLALYAHGRAITSDDVDELIADTRERSVFELTDAIGAADRPRALAAVASLCDQRESAVGVVVMLARHIRQLSLLHALRARNEPRNQWASQIGVPPFVVDKLVAQAKSYTPQALALATRRLADADRALKGDITLDGRTSPFTGPQMKALGRELGERVILERIVDGIVQLAGS